MEAKHYNTAGWLAVILVPLYFLSSVIVIAQEVISYVKGTNEVPAMGPGDFMISILGLLSAYLLYVFRRLLRERYDFTGVDKLLLIAIVVDLVGSLVTTPILLLFEFSVGAIVAFFIPTVIGLGVLYISIARRLLAAESRLNSSIVSYANVLLVNYRQST